MRLLITIIYSILLAWGFSVGVRQIYQGYRRPKELLNPLFGNRIAIHLFAVHIVIVTVDLFVIGPWALAHKSLFWYWGSRIALFTWALPIAAYLNRNPQSFGQFIGHWVRFRNFFEYTLHVVVAAMAVNWFHYYILLWWLVAYRYLDVGPRRALQKLYNTPAKLAARPWAPWLNFVTIFSIYVLAFLAVYNRQILFAKVPKASAPVHATAHWEVAVVVAVNIALALWLWTLTRKYTDSLLAQRTAAAGPVAEPAPPSHVLGGH